MGPPVYRRPPREMFNVFGYLGTQAAIARGTRILHKILADLDIVHKCYCAGHAFRLSLRFKRKN